MRIIRAMLRSGSALALLLLCACGNNGAGTADAQVEPTGDSAVPDAGEPDAFDECPGQANFQVGVEDWADGGALAGVVVTDGNVQKSSAPNGRVVLCVANTGPITIRFSHDDYLDRVHSTTGEIVSELASTPGVASFRMLKPADADALYDGVGLTRAGDAVTAMAMVQERDSGSELAGATVSLDATNEGAYTPGEAADELLLGQVTQEDGRVLFLNAEAGATSMTATGAGACLAPASVELEAGSVSSATIACSP